MESFEAVRCLEPSGILDTQGY